MDMKGRIYGSSVLKQGEKGLNKIGTYYQNMCLLSFTLKANRKEEKGP
jgi:hypothetical protein